MPQIYLEVYNFSGSANLSMSYSISGYWTLPLHPQSKEAQSIITPNVIYLPTRNQQGAFNYVTNFQTKTKNCSPTSRITKSMVGRLYCKCTYRDVTLKTIIKIKNHGLYPKICVLYHMSVRLCNTIVWKYVAKLIPQSTRRDLTTPDNYN